jgi:predicted transcriptional regulator
MKTQQISIRLTAEQLQSIDQIAMKTVGERSDHIRKALDLYIEQYQEVKPDPILDSLASRYTMPDDDGDPYPAYLIE